jgi:rod shape-determining protein MreC
VVAGDLLVTSGLGGVFPAGYPVGTVAEVKRDPAQSLADVEVRPAASLDRAREVMFVWLKSDAAAPLSTPAVAASSGGVTAPPGAAVASTGAQTAPRQAVPPAAAAAPHPGAPKK